MGVEQQPEKTPPLYPHQYEAVKFLMGRKLALLADEMGLGKSRSVIETIAKLQKPKTKSKRKPCLVVCPAIARFNWRREFEKYDRLKHPTFIASSEKMLPKWDRKSHLIVSYNLTDRLSMFLREEYGHIKNAHPFFTCVLDEVHYLKNRKTVRTKHVLGNDGVCRFSDRIWSLSGTPMPNHAGELWVLLYTFGVTQLSYKDFVKRFCLVRGGFFAGDRFVPEIISGTRKEKIPELKTLLSKIMLRRTTQSAEVKLPPIRFGEIIVEKPKGEDVVLPSDLLDSPIDERRLEEELLSVKGVDLSWETLMLLSPSVSTLRRYTGLLKVEKLSQVLNEELDNESYEKIVVFCNHKAVVNGLVSRLSKHNPVSLHGLTTPTQRTNNIDRFQSDPSCRVIVCNILTAGTAINLTSATQVVFAELDWVPGNNTQALKRAHRIGTKNSIFVRIVSLENSLDYRINDILRRKMENILLLFGEDSEKMNYAVDTRDFDR